MISTQESEEPKKPNKIYRRARKLSWIAEVVVVLGGALIVWLIARILTTA